MRPRDIVYLNKKDREVSERNETVCKVLDNLGDFLFVGEFEEFLYDSPHLPLFELKGSLTNTLQSLWLRGKVHRVRVLRNFAWKYLPKSTFKTQLELDILCFIRRVHLKKHPLVSLESVVYNFEVSTEDVLKAANELKKKGLLTEIPSSISRVSLWYSPDTSLDRYSQQVVDNLLRRAKVFTSRANRSSFKAGTINHAD